MPQSRRLAAIMFTDIVGYTALMGKDEKKAFELLRKNRDIQKPLINRYNGNWIKELGDGVLASFHTVTDAVYCAASIHEACNNVDGLQLRIGIHLGEVIFENNDVFGDGVNIASRLQALASPGDTWVSEAVHKNLVNKKEITSEFVREEQLKNVSEPVQVYEITVKEIPAHRPDTVKAYKKQDITEKSKRKKIIFVVGIIVLAVLIAVYFLFFNKQTNQIAGDEVTAEKSIAVLPFRNMSDEKENQYFTDGMMDEILNKLSKIKEFRVISRTSVEQYRNTEKSSREIAKELGVVYILEGSAQQYGDEIKIISSLIQAVTDEKPIWSYNETKPYREVFVLQAEIANSIAKQLEAKLSPQENDLVNKAAATNLDAYDLYLRGREYIIRYWSNQNERDLDNARSLFRSALQADSQFALAWVGLGLEYRDRNWDAAEYLEEHYLDSVKHYCDKAISLDGNLEDAFWLRGRYYQSRNKHDEAIADQEKAISIDPNYAWSYWALGIVYHEKREFLKGLGNFKRASKLIRGGTELPNLLVQSASLYISIGDFQTADFLIEKATELKPDLLSAHAIGAWSATLQSKLDQALVNALKMVAIDSNSSDALNTLSNAYAYLKDFDNALKFYEKAESKMKKTGDIRITNIHRIGYILWNKGKKEEAEKLFSKQIKTMEETRRLGRWARNYNYNLAATYAFRGDEKKALEYLEAYKRDGFNHGLEYFIKVDPLFEGLRTNKEFIKIVDGAQAEKAKIKDGIKELEKKGEL